MNTIKPEYLADKSANDIVSAMNGLKKNQAIVYHAGIAEDWTNRMDGDYFVIQSAIERLRANGVITLAQMRAENPNPRSVLNYFHYVAIGL